MEKEQKKNFNLKNILKPYVSNWLWFVISILAMLVLAFIYVKTKAPTYKVQTSVLIKDARKMSSASGDFGVLESIGAFPNMGTNSIENELQLFKSVTIIEDVLKDHNYQSPLYSETSPYDVELYGETSPYKITIISEKKVEEGPKEPIYIKNESGKLILSSEEWKRDIVGEFNRTVGLPFANVMITRNTEFVPDSKNKLEKIYFKYSLFDDAVDDYQKSLKVDLLDKDATVIGLSVNFNNRDKAKDFLNSLVRQYNIYSVNDKNVEAKKTKDFIDSRITVISDELGNVEAQKQQYKSSNNIVDLPTEARMNLNVKEQTRMQIMNYDTQLAMNNILLSYLRTKGNTDVLPLNVGVGNEVAGRSVQEYNALVLKRNRLLETATPDNPVVKETEQQIADLRSTLREGLEKTISSIQLIRNELVTQFNASEGNISKIPVQERQFREIERQLQIKENLFLLLLQKREEAALSMEITSEKARIVDRAYSKKKPVSPRKIFAFPLALAAGFLLPLSVIYLRELLNDSIKTRKDIEAGSKMPVIAEIPALTDRNAKVVKTNDVSPIAESFRILSTNVKYLLPQTGETPVIMVTSTVKGEGKTFVSVNYALVLAATGKKVVVIGSDIRNPQLQRYNPTEKYTKGLTEYLVGEIKQPQDIIKPSGFDRNCDFIYSGSIPPNPVNLLESSRYAELIEYLKNNYDFIILDTAPMMLVTDSQLIAKYADATIYILRSETSKHDYVEFADKQMENNAINNVAFVLNDVKKINLGYSNQFGYGYRKERKKWWQFK